MRKRAFEPFKFGQSKTSRQSYFPAVVRTSDTTEASQVKRTRKARGRGSPPELRAADD